MEKKMETTIILGLYSPLSAHFQALFLEGKIRFSGGPGSRHL